MREEGEEKEEDVKTITPLPKVFNSPLRLLFVFIASVGLSYDFNKKNQSKWLLKISL